MPTKSKPKLAVGVDIGGARTRCVVCAVEDGRLRFLGAGSAASQGWQKGRLADPKGIAAAVSAAVKEAESRAKVLVESVVLGIGGATVQANQGRGVYEFGRPREITTDDLAYAVELASRVRLQDDRMLIHVFPQDFTVDGRAGYRNPVGLQATRLEANVLLVTTSELEHNGLVSAAHEAHLSVDDTVFEPVACAYSAILPEERHRGAAIVDLGMHSTGLVVYDGDAAVGAASLPVAADHLTRDIVVGLNYYHGITISYENAEILKREYGCAMIGLSNDNTLVDVPSSDGRTSREVSRRQLNEILEARAEEIFMFLKQEIQQAGMDQALMEGVFLTGGGARLHGMLDMAERILTCHAKFGLAVGIQDWPQNFQDPAWTTGAGLAMYSARLKLFKQQRRKPPGLLGFLGI
ncbi:MAG: cell division protein FtsA [Bryobacterales bacterium]|nr:cell division protein FtsA [Bryobacterales bacterium]